MSVISGTIGAIMGSNSQEKAANTSAQAARDTSAQQVAFQEKALKSQQDMMSPFGKIGAQGLAQLYGQNVDYIDPQTGEKTTYNGGGGDFNLMHDPYTGEIMQLPSYDAEYTDKLGRYESDPGTEAQRALDSKRLAQQEQQRVGYSTPGASGARAAELNQKYDVQGYDKYKQQLKDRYTALQGEFASKRAMTADQYDQITQKMNLGLGATKTLGSAGQNFANQAGNAVGQSGAAQGAAAMASGQAQAGMWSGLGSASANTFGAGLKGYQAGKDLGWWGSNAGTAAAAATGTAATGTAATGAGEIGAVDLLQI